MTFFCLYAKDRWLLVQPLSAENLQHLHAVPSAHQSLCCVCQSLLAPTNVSSPDHPLPSHHYHMDSCLYFPPLQTPQWSKDILPISSPHPEQWGINFWLFCLSHFQYKCHTLFSIGSFWKLAILFYIKYTTNGAFSLQQAGSWISFTVMTQTLPGKFETERRQHLKCCLWKRIPEI